MRYITINTSEENFPEILRMQRSLAQITGAFKVTHAEVQRPLLATEETKKSPVPVGTTSLHASICSLIKSRPEIHSFKMDWLVKQYPKYSRIQLNRACTYLIAVRRLHRVNRGEYRRGPRFWK
jgi:hypothetical protein